VLCLQADLTIEAEVERRWLRLKARDENPLL